MTKVIVDPVIGPLINRQQYNDRDMQLMNDKNSASILSQVFSLDCQQSNESYMQLRNNRNRPSTCRRSTH